MAHKTSTELKTKFEIGDTPTGADFKDLITSSQNMTNENLQPTKIPNGTTFNIDQCTFTFQGGVAEITNNSATGDLEIPWQPFPCSVGSGAFYYSSITGLSIPSSVVSLGTIAFSNCYSLTGDLIIPDSVTSMGANTFSACGPTSLKISESLEVIPASAFSGFGNLTGTLVIPDSVTSIGSNAFYYTGNVSELILSNSLITIGNSAFYNCGVSTPVLMPSTLETIGSSAFSYCTNLTAVYLSSSLISIGSNAFNYCYSMEDVYINSVPSSSWTGSFALSTSGPALNIYVTADVLSQYDSAWKSSQGASSSTVSLWTSYPDPMP